MENTEENSEKIWKLWKKDKLNVKRKLWNDMENMDEMWNDMENMEERYVEKWTDMENMEER
jgi:hypothetical protein